MFRPCHRIAIGFAILGCLCAPTLGLAQKPPGSPYAPPTDSQSPPYPGVYPSTDGSYPTPYPTAPYPTPPTGNRVQHRGFQNGAQQLGGTGQEFEGAMRVATVGDEVILASDIMPRIDKLLAKYRDQIPPSEYQRQRWMLARQALNNLLDVKRVMHDFKRTIPEDRLPVIREQVDESFEKARLPQLLEALKVNSRAELEAKLQEEGTSLAQERDNYFERSLAQQWLRQQTDTKATFSHDELMAYYQDHLKDFEQTAKVRWQQLSVRFSKYGSKAEAYAMLAEMGNAVLRGAVFEQVAAHSSDGITAKEGGVRDWTQRGAVASKELEQALFSLPPNQLSPIIEGANAFHIIRVLQRQEQHVTPFRDAQLEIAEKLAEQANETAAKEYQARLEREIRVWTVFDDPRFVQRIGLPPAPPRR